MNHGAPSAAISLAFALSCPFAWGLSINGAVVDDSSGKPVLDPDVRVFGQRPPLIGLQSNHDGTFQTGDLPPGDYTVAAWHHGYLYTAVPWRIGNEETSQPSLLVRLVPLGAIEGRLTGLEGRTARVLALVRSADAKSTSEIWKPVVDTIGARSDAAPVRGAPVDSDGAFRIPELPPGAYALVVAYGNSQVAARQDPADFKDGVSSGILRYPDGNGAFELDGGSTLRIQVAIPSAAGRVIDGHIEIADSQSWYWVTLSNPDQPALAVAITTTDEKGMFAFRGVVPGSYELLVVAGRGERGNRSFDPASVYRASARTSVDIRERDARGVAIQPLHGTSASLTIHGAAPSAGTRCGFLTTGVTLTPAEDWGVDLEHRQERVKTDSERFPQSPESVDGLAPAKYGVSVDGFGGCLLADRPVLDLSNTLTGSLDLNLTEPGIVRGRAGASGESSSGWEVILIPDDFTEGWSVLPMGWFHGSPFDSRRGGFPGQQLYTAPTQLNIYLPHVLISPVGLDARFEFSDVPAGRYRIAVRPADPTLTSPELAAGRDRERIDVSPAGVAEIDLPLPESLSARPGSNRQ